MKKSKKRVINIILALTMLLSLIPALGGITLAAPEDDVTDALAALTLGDTSNVTANLTLPLSGLSGTTIAWSSNSGYLWADGTVLRPPSGAAATVTLTATVSKEGASGTKNFTVVIPAFVASSRAISTVKLDPNSSVVGPSFSMNSPVGTVPRLPYQVWVTYSDGYSEWRSVLWSNAGTSTSTENTQAGYTVGRQYSITGNITGDTSITAGYALTMNITVVAGGYTTPSSVPVAQTLPLSKISINGNNRLTSNRDRAVSTIAGWSVTRHLYNYRATFGLSTSGYDSPNGWDATTCHLKGHGSGHYMSALAFAYNSNPTSAQKTTLLNNMTRMVNEIRDMQLMTFQPNAAAGKVLEAKDIFLDAELRAVPDGRFTTLNAYNDPTYFGKGYVNCIQPLHPILVEKYTGYNDTSGVWAPYYSIHKQLAGWLDIYYALYPDPATRATAEKSLLIAKDMGLWISNRLVNRTFLGASGARTQYGNRYEMWNIYIAGEYGGTNESLARIADLVTDPDEKAALLEGAKAFDNTAFFDPLKNNVDSIRTRHANQHIPQITGAIWTFKGTNDPAYYNLSENFWNFVQGRYRYSPGGVGSGEMFRQPYTQIANIGTTINECCCAYNLAKLTKDMATFDPDNAKYMDYYERILYNQIVGSIRPTSYSVDYQYAVGPGASKPGGNSTPMSSCCGGTGSENHVKYQEAAYFVSDDTVWVNLYMPTTLTWDAKAVSITQDCPWPTESSTIKVAGSANFAMKLRVPWWATRGFDIKLNGVSIAASYQPSSYAIIPARAWSASDTVTVTMPFQASIDYAPDKSSSSWAGTFMYGPLAMTSADSAWSVVSVNTNLSDVQLLGASGGTTGTNSSLYTMTVGSKASMQPDYYRTGTSTHYFRITLVSTGIDRTPLYAKLVEARAFPSTSYSVLSFANLQTAIGTAVGIYQNNNTTQTQVTNQVTALNNAINALAPNEEGKAALLDLINQALARKAEQEAWELNPVGSKPWAPYGYARMLTALGTAQAVYINTEATQSQVTAQETALQEALRTMRPGHLAELEDLDPLKALITLARTYISAIYTQASLIILQEAIDYGEDMVAYVTNGSGTPDMIAAAISQLNNAIAGMEIDLNAPLPSITAISPSTAVANSATTFSATTIQVAGSTLKYAWSVSPSTGVTISNAAAASPSIVFSAAGSYSVSLTVTDHLDRDVTFSRSVTVSSRAAAPYNVGLTSRGTTLQASYRNGTGNSGSLTLPIDGSTAGRTAPNSLNTWNSSVRQFFQLTFADPVTIYAVNVHWLSDGAGTGAPRVGTSATTYNQIKVPANMAAPVPGVTGGTSGNNTNTTSVADANWRILPIFDRNGAAIANNQIGSIVNNPSTTVRWNYAGFTPVETKYVLMHLGPSNSNGGTNNGIGINQWQCFALEPLRLIENINLTVAPGELKAADFPAKYNTDMLMIDFSTATFAATTNVISYPNAQYKDVKGDITLRWTQSQINAALAGRAGDAFTVAGTNPTLGYTLNINATFSAIANITETNLTTVLGTQPSLPAMVGITYENGDTKQVPVVWEAVTDAMLYGGQSYTVKGSVVGTDMKAITNVTVTSDSIDDAYGILITVSANPADPSDISVSYVVAQYDEGASANVRLLYGVYDKATGKLLCLGEAPLPIQKPFLSYSVKAAIPAGVNPASVTVRGFVWSDIYVPLAVIKQYN